MRFFKSLILTAILVSQSCFALEPSSCQEVLNYIESDLPQYGTLKSSDGFVYVSVDEEYIKKLVSLIPEAGFEAPPYFGELYDTGAHISVIYPQEWGDREPVTLSEIGDTIHFQVSGCEIWKTPFWRGFEKVWVVLVEAPELDRLREKYGFSRGFPHGFCFNITIGVKPTGVKAA